MFFFSAIQHGDHEEVQRLLDIQRDLIFAQDENGKSPILAAAYANKREIANFLAEKTVLLNIFEAATIGKLTHIIRLLAKDPSEVNAHANDGSQPLELAAYFGHIDVADYLLKAGASVNSSQKNEEKLTPLHIATLNGHLETAGFLIANGAEVNIHQIDGLTPLHIAAKKGYFSMVRLLLYNGADQSLESADGKTPLDYARENGHTDTLDLLEQGITKRFRSA